MKNNLVVEGNIQKVDNNLNIQLDDIEVSDPETNPYLVLLLAITI